MTSRSKTPQRCHYWIERRHPELRYTFGSRRCSRITRHPSGYCHIHRPPEKK